MKGKGSYRIACRTVLAVALSAILAPSPALTAQGPEDTPRAAAQRARLAGDFLEASEILERALAAERESARVSPEVLEDIIRLRLEWSEASAIADYLWQFFQAGRSTGVEYYALIALEDPEGRFAAEEPDLLTLVAMSLSRQVYSPLDFAGSSTGQRLQRLATTSSVGQGIEELLRWHEPGVWPPPGSLSSTCSAEYLDHLAERHHGLEWWWEPTPASQLGTTRLHAARSLIGQVGKMLAPERRGRRSEGDDANSENLDFSETSLCVAALLNRDSIITGPFRSLVWTYINRGMEEPLKDLYGQNKNQFHTVDVGYLKPIHDAYEFHWTHSWYYRGVAFAIVSFGGCVLLDYCFSDNPNATGTITITP